MGFFSSGNLYQFLNNQNSKELIGAEVGVSQGTNLAYMLVNSPSISKIFAIDPYLAYQDWCGFVSQEMQDQNKAITKYKMDSLGLSDRIEFVYKPSDEACNDIEDGSLDFIYIDGDHSYEWAYKDFNNYYSKVKTGGIFAGHDFSLAGVNRALQEFMNSLGLEFEKDLVLLENDSWLLYKN